MISPHLMLDNSTFSWGKLMSLSDYIVFHIFSMYWGRSETGMLPLTSYLFFVLLTKNYFNEPILLSQFAFSLYWSLEGRKKTVSWNTSSSCTWVLSAGLGILSQASLTFATNFSFRASGFYFFSTKSRTTNTICLGF